MILQVGSYKLRRKRIFKMAPLHHHFEALGWQESKIIVRFWITGLVHGAVRADHSESYDENRRHKRVLVVGDGASGRAAVELLREGNGAHVPSRRGSRAWVRN